MATGIGLGIWDHINQSQTLAYQLKDLNVYFGFVDPPVNEGLFNLSLRLDQGIADVRSAPDAFAEYLDAASHGRSSRSLDAQYTLPPSYAGGSSSGVMTTTGNFIAQTRLAGIPQRTANNSRSLDVTQN